MNKCLGPNCERKIEKDYLFCSIECACYAGVFDVKTGFIQDKLDALLHKLDRKDFIIEPNQIIVSESIVIKWCNLCDAFFVKCPRCGNNTCNGGSGEDKESPDGKCQICNIAYDLADSINKSPDVDKNIEKLLHWRKPKKEVEN